MTLSRWWQPSPRASLPTDGLGVHDLGQTVSLTCDEGMARSQFRGEDSEDVMHETASSYIEDASYLIWLRMRWADVANSVFEPAPSLLFDVLDVPGGSEPPRFSKVQTQMYAIEYEGPALLRLVSLRH